MKHRMRFQKQKSSVDNEMQMMVKKVKEISEESHKSHQPEYL